MNATKAVKEAEWACLPPEKAMIKVKEKASIMLTVNRNVERSAVEHYGSTFGRVT